MSKFTKDVIDTSYGWWDGMRGLAEQLRAAILHKWHAWTGESSRALDRVAEKRDALREDLYW